MDGIASMFNLAATIAAFVVAYRWVMALRTEIAETHRAVRDLKSSVVELVEAANDLLKGNGTLLEGTRVLLETTSDASDMLQELTTAKLAGG